MVPPTCVYRCINEDGTLHAFTAVRSTHSMKNRLELTPGCARHVRVRVSDNEVRCSDDICLSKGCAAQRCLSVNAWLCLLTLPGGTHEDRQRLRSRSNH